MGLLGSSGPSAFSFLVHLLPYSEFGTVFDSLPIKSGCQPPGLLPTSGPPNVDAVRQALNLTVPNLVCPSDPRDRYKYPPSRTIGQWWWNECMYFQSSYRGMCSTTKAALLYGIWGTAGAPCPYVPTPSDPKRFPDGALFPNGVAPKIADFIDGTSRTVLCCETLDNAQPAPLGSDYGGRQGWLYPAATLMYGLPGPTTENLANDPLDTPINYVGFPKTSTAPQFWAPERYDPTNPSGPTAPTSTYRTYLAYDFMVVDLNTYCNSAFLITGDTSSGKNNVRPMFGPSAAHPHVVNHLFADGSVRSIPKDIDAAAYFFLITRAGHDPNPDMTK